MTTNGKPRILMCEPAFYGVEYVINPWMEAGRMRVRHHDAVRQWNELVEVMRGIACVTFIEARAGLPDMVFTANAGLVVGNLFIPSRFRHKERAGEEPCFSAWAAEAGYSVQTAPDGISFEGAGDALFDRRMKVLWLGHGFRSDESAVTAIRALAEAVGYAVEPLRLVDPRFYHLDTCLCPLSDGSLMYYPPALSAESAQRVEELVPAADLLPVSAVDAEAFACNAVNLDGVIVLNQASLDLKVRLRERGFETIETPLTEYIYAGGAARCLTLRLDEPVPATE